MNSTEYDKLTDEEIRIKVAECHGFIDIRKGSNSILPHGSLVLANGETFQKAPLPDYLNDLNACHDFEKGMNEDQVEAYCVTLFHCVDKKSKEKGWLTIHATAEQRCKAFVLIMTQDNGMI